MVLGTDCPQKSGQVVFSQQQNPIFALFIFVFSFSKAMHKFNENLLPVELISNNYLIRIDSGYLLLNFLTR